MSKRGHVIAAALAAVLAGCQAPVKQQKQERAMAMRVDTEPVPEDASLDLGFFDVHVHLNDVEMARTLMGEHGIERAVVFWGRDSSNESIRAAAAADPGRFVPFVSVSPEREAYRRYWDARDAALLAEVDDALSSGGFAGIGELSVTHFAGHGIPEATYGPLHPLTIGAMELARKHAVPVNLHCEITAVDDLAELLRRFDDVVVIWAHGGYSSPEIAARMLDAHDGLVYELSARTWRNHPASPDYTIYADDRHVSSAWLELIEARPTRFVVGTDAALHSLPRERAKIGGVKRLLEQLTPPTRRLVARGNIERLLGLGETSHGR